MYIGSLIPRWPRRKSRLRDRPFNEKEAKCPPRTHGSRRESKAHQRPLFDLIENWEVICKAGSDPPPEIKGSQRRADRTLSASSSSSLRVSSHAMHPSVMLWP